MIVAGMRAKAAKRKRPWKWALLGILVVVLGFGTWWGAGIYSSLNNFSKPQMDSIFRNIPETVADKPPEWEGTERVNILLLGGDARGVDEGQAARSDSLLVASIDPVSKKAHIFSILRDTYVQIPGFDHNRINTAITLGGPNLAMETVGDLLGLEIQYYLYADFEGFKALIDSIGGIDYEVEKDMRYTDNADKNRYDINLKKGYQHLDGDKALQYVRFRHDKLSDFTRTERQRNFLKAVAKQMQSTWNFIQMKKILDSVQPYIETNLQVSDMLKLGQLGLKAHMAGSEQLPPMDLITAKRVGGADVIGIRDEDMLRQFVQDSLAKDDTAAITTTPVSDTSNMIENNSNSNTNTNSSSSEAVAAPSP
jgi:LCP family protein required for cell wall assembly